jgi:ligand-binding sensor domain-containing protein
VADERHDLAVARRDASPIRFRVLRDTGLAVLLLLATAAAGQEANPHFDHLGEEQNLATTRINGVTQDGAGFVWLATGAGLSRFDGYSFTSFRNTPEDPSSLPGNYVRCVFTDRRGHVWAGTSKGLARWEPRLGSFVNHLPDTYVRHIAEGRDDTLWLSTDRGVLNLDPASMRSVAYASRPGDKRSLSLERVLATLETSDRSVWMATDGDGVTRLDAQRQNFRSYRHDPADPKTLSNDIVMSLFQDSKGRLWLGTATGLNLHDPATDTFTSYPIQADVIFSICEEARGRLWIASYDGLTRFDPDQGTAVTYSHSPEDRTSLASNKVRSLYVSRDGLLWVGTYDGGVDVYDPRTTRFSHYRKTGSSRPGLSSNHVSSLLEGRDGTLWIGTYGGGLNRFDPATGRFTTFPSDPEHPRALSGTEVFALLEDSRGDLWVGTQDGGLNRLNRATGTFDRFRKEPGNPYSLGSDAVLTLLEDADGVLWVGTRGGGLSRFDRATGRFTSYRHDPGDESSLGSDSVFTLARDKAGFIWIVNDGGGIDRFDPSTGQFTRFRHKNGDPTSLTENFVWAILPDSKGRLWAGTDGGGLDRFDPATGVFRHYRMKDGLSDDTIYGILEDRQGRLWLSHSRGIDRFDPASGAIQRFDQEDGLQGKEFSPSASHAGRSGRFYFGGVEGFSVFDPAAIDVDPFVPPIVLTSFSLFNKPVEVGPSSVLPVTIGASRTIELGWRDSIFAFEFSALSHRLAKRRRFAYQLVGFDRDWVVTDWRNRKANYTNLGHGRYVFRVKAANGPGEWGANAAEVEVILLPPPWKAWWAYSLYALLAIGAVLSFVRFQEAKVERERAISERLRQADKLKDEFLANTSHELRTPLNGIIGIADSLLEGVTGKLPDETKANLRMIVSSGRRLYHLVNDILDFSKLRNRDLALQLGPVDMHTLTEVVLTLSRPLVRGKSVELVNEIPETTPAVWADENRGRTRTDRLCRRHRNRHSRRRAGADLPLFRTGGRFHRAGLRRDRPRADGDPPTRGTSRREGVGRVGGGKRFALLLLCAAQRCSGPRSGKGRQPRGTLPSGARGRPAIGSGRETVGRRRRAHPRG